MAENATASCGNHEWFECPDVVMHRYDDDDGVWFGIPIRDGGRSAITINFCPWCGSRLTS